MLRFQGGLLSTLVIPLCIVFLASCSSGGGGGGDSAPSTPVGVVVSANDTANTLQWNSVSGATGYNVYWSSSSGAGVSGKKISTTSTAYAHTALTNGTTIFYVITAVNSIGESAPSVETSGTPAIPPPGAPSLTTVIPGNQQTLLSWNPVAGATSYNLYWSNSSVSAATGTKIVNVTSPYQHSGLTNGSTYYYVLRTVSAAGESSPSSVISATPFVPPYATAQYPFDLGSAPLAGYAETIPNDTTDFHYTISVTPGSAYMFTLNNVVDGGSLEVFTNNSWDQFGVGLACSDYRYSYIKQRPQCIAVAPASGLFYIRIGSTVTYPENVSYVENVSLKIDEVVNQGSIATPLNLGAAPTSPVLATVLGTGESIYKVAVTPGNYYRVKLADWKDSGASSSTLFLGVFDGAYSGPDLGTAPNRLCSDYGGNSDVDHQHRLRTIHCLAKPTASYLTIVTDETSFGQGATYNISVEAAVKEGTSSTPVNVAGDALVYHGEATAEPGSFSNGYSYYQLSVTPSTNYLVDLRGMHEQLELIIEQDSTFTYASCNSREFNLIDESCLVNSGVAGKIYALVETPRDVTDTFILSAMPAPAGAVAPARYPNEGLAGTPLSIGPGLPVTNRLSTVGVGSSYYSIPATPASTMRVSATEMNVDVDIHVYSDSGYLNRLCASRNSDAQDDSCTFTVPAGIGTIYIRVDGQFTTNNGSWSSKTELDVGAMFRLTVEAI
jgi:hypothetical protein